jgi:hypothetical protein
VSSIGTLGAIAGPGTGDIGCVLVALLLLEDDIVFNWIVVSVYAAYHFVRGRWVDIYRTSRFGPDVTLAHRWLASTNARPRFGESRASPKLAE